MVLGKKSVPCIYSFVEGGFRILIKCILAGALLVFRPIIRCHIAQSGQKVVSIGSQLISPDNIS